MISIVSTQWLFDSLFTNNSIVIDDVDVARTFIKLVDGSFGPPPGISDTIIDNLDGTFTLASPQQNKWNFDENGNLNTYVDPAGVTVSLTYSSGPLSDLRNQFVHSFTGEKDIQLFPIPEVLLAFPEHFQK